MNVLRIVGGDERTRAEVAVRTALCGHVNATVALARTKADWALLNRLEGNVAVIVFDRGYADPEFGEWPVFHIDDLEACVEYLACVRAFDPHADELDFAECAW